MQEVYKLGGAFSFSPLLWVIFPFHLEGGSGGNSYVYDTFVVGMIFYLSTNSTEYQVYLFTDLSSLLKISILIFVL